MNTSIPEVHQEVVMGVGLEDETLDNALETGGWWAVVYKAYTMPYYYNWSKGRISKAPYLRFMFFQFILIVALGFIAASKKDLSQIVISLVGVLIFLPTITMLGRRLQGINRSAWILIPVFIIPYIAFYLCLYFFLFAYVNNTLMLRTPSTFFSVILIGGAVISFIPLIIVGILPDKIKK